VAAATGASQWAASVKTRRAVLDALMLVMILPVGSGPRGIDAFDPTAFGSTGSSCGATDLAEITHRSTSSRAALTSLCGASSAARVRTRSSLRADDVRAVISAVRNASSAACSTSPACRWASASHDVYSVTSRVNQSS